MAEHDYTGSYTTVQRWVKRWWIERDYRELEHGLGLDHFEGRTWVGWHHHVTLVAAAHLFITEQRLVVESKVSGVV